MMVDQFKRCFLRLKQYACYQDDEALLTQHFVRGLKDSISGDVHLHQPCTLALAMEKARIAKGNIAKGFSSRSSTQGQSSRPLG